MGRQMNRSVSEGSLVLLFFDLRRQWLIRVDSGRQFHTHKGFIQLADMVGKPFGSEIKSSLGYSFWVLRPTTYDLIMHSARRTQIMYPKDIGLIVLKLALTSGMQVLEIGTGSGAMTVAAATAVKPSGHVHTYESNAEFADVAERNLRRASLSEFVTIHRTDANAGIEGSDFDAAIVDIGDPWTVIPLVHRALVNGAPAVSFSPTMNQVERVACTFRDSGFQNVQTMECFVREIRVETGKTRPVTTMVAHTGYLTFAQKALKEA